MKKSLFILLCSIILTSCIPTGGAGVTVKPIDTSINLTRIAIGSCLRQDLNHSIFRSIRDLNPQLYIAMGDNMYADNLITNPNYAGWIQAQYDILNNSYDFKTTRATIQSIATWDDHDYGINNAGKEFPYKTQSKDLFLNFWNEPASSPRRMRDGIYTSYMYGDDDHKVQIIVLDCRYNLDVISNEPITPTTDVSKSILGPAQWAWLASELTKPAKIRIVVSSSQMCIQNNGWEGWPNYPHELNKFFQTVKDANAEGLFVVSGDVHYSEFSKRTPSGQYPIYDFTSSGMTHTEGRPAANMYRIGSAYTNLSFGIIDINWDVNPVQISMNICDYNGNFVKQQVISLDELKF